MIGTILFNLAAILIITSVGLHFASAPIAYIKYVGTWFFPLWILFGVLMGLQFASYVMRTRQMPPVLSQSRQLAISSLKSRKDNATLLFYLFFDPVIHVWSMSVAVGILQLGGAWANDSLSGRYSYLA